MDMYDAKQLYDRLKVSEREDGILDLDARLRAMNGPLLAWYEEHARILPWRENPEGYRVWISEIMLQQTRVEAVKPYFERFLEALPDVASLASVEDDRLMKLWEGLGYYNRARNLKKAAGVIMEEYGGGERLYLQQNGHRAIVLGEHLHVCAKFPVLDLEPLLPARGHEMLIQGNGQSGRRGMGEARPPGRGVGIQGKLADHQHSAPNSGQV